MGSPVPNPRRQAAPFSPPPGKRPREPWIRRSFAAFLGWILLTVGAGGKLPAAARPAGAIPGGCSFYIVIDAVANPQALADVESFLPALPAALQRLVEAGILSPTERPSSLILAGFLQQDTVYLSVLVGGKYDQAAIRKSLGTRLTLVSASPPPALYQTASGSQPPIGILFPTSGGLAAGRPETLQRIFRTPQAATPPPELLRKALEGDNFVTLYADREILSRLFSPSATGEGFDTLRQIFGGIADLAWTVESPVSGRCRIRMQCLQSEDAAGVAALLRNYLSLALLTAGQEEAQAAAILKTFTVDAQDRWVDVRFSIPPPVLEKIFASLFNF
jgi:hypothetical protein